jgi:hypothetical protein
MNDCKWRDAAEAHSSASGSKPRHLTAHTFQQSDRLYEGHLRTLTVRTSHYFFFS